MDYALLDLGLGKYCFNCLWKTGQSIHTRNQYIFYPPPGFSGHSGWRARTWHFHFDQHTFRGHPYVLPYRSQSQCKQHVLQSAHHYVHGNGSHQAELLPAKALRYAAFIQVFFRCNFFYCHKSSVRHIASLLSTLTLFI